MKKRLLALVLVLTMMTMGVAYAAWSQVVTVSGDVATGELKVVMYPEPDIEFTGNGMLPSDGTLDRTSIYRDDVVTYDWEWGSYASISSTKDHDGEFNYTVSATTDNFYPGAEGTIYFLLKNEGTLPVTLSITDDFDFDEFVIDRYVMARMESNYSFDWLGGFTDSHGEKLFTREEMNSILDGEELMPGDNLMVIVRVSMDIEADETTMWEENTAINGIDTDGFEFVIPFIINQYNN